tara:strand:- start:13067 stop:14374 length:1308 start_codon:yes stop_codon:yes gene_type:complete
MSDPNPTSKCPWKLTITTGPDEGRSYLVNDECSLVIGRGSDSDTKIRDPRLSRIHCELRRLGDEVEIIDRGGSGGTYLDGIRIDTRHTMKLGSVIRIGESELRLDRESLFDMTTIVPSHPLATEVQSTAEPPRAAETLSVGKITALEGQVFLRFRLDKLIATGQNSIMFKGRDVKRGRDVAVKILKPQMATDDTQRDRFIRAMRTTLPIKHPNIVRTRKAGRTGAYCWAAFDWVDGISVRELIEKIGIGGVLDWKQVYRIAVHIGRALEEASKHRIVHRNVTPSNLLRRSNDKSFLLTDLIFARALEYTDAAQLTRPGDVVGDLGYISPERIFDATSVDERSDQYSLGATLFTLLSGHPPYEAMDVADLVERFRTTEPISPAETQIGMDERFCDVVMRMIHKSASSRFASPAALLRELQNVGNLAGLDADWAEWS